MSADLPTHSHMDACRNNHYVCASKCQVPGVWMPAGLPSNYGACSQCSYHCHPSETDAKQLPCLSSLAQPHSDWKETGGSVSQPAVLKAAGIMGLSPP